MGFAQKLQTQNAPKNHGAGCLDCLNGVHASPTVFSVNDAHQAPSAEFASLLNKADLSEDEKKSLASYKRQNINIIIDSADQSDMEAAIGKIFGGNSRVSADIAKALTDKRVLGGLNYDLVDFFYKNRKHDPKVTSNRPFFERVTDFLRNPFGRKHNRKSDEGREFLTTLEEEAKVHPEGIKYINVAHRYLRALLHSPKAFQPTVGEDGRVIEGSENTVKYRKAIMSYLLPQLLDILQSGKFPEYEGVADKLSDVLIDALGDKYKKLANDPRATEIQIYDHDAGTVEVHDKKFQYNAKGYGDIVGKEFKINPSAPQGITHMGKEYKADHAHFHIGTEHKIFGRDGKPVKADGELHVVHTSDSGKAFVLTAFIKVTDKPNPLIQEMIDRDKGEQTGEAKKFSYMDLAGFKNGKYLVDSKGSLTTFPYSSGVTFAILQDSFIEVTAEQFKALQEMLKPEKEKGEKRDNIAAEAENTREIQKNYGKPIFIAGSTSYEKNQSPAL